nr:LamG-like jellyroll fold domain-containing protein [uncultured Psychroserpens sp.]
MKGVHHVISFIVFVVFAMSNTVAQSGIYESYIIIDSGSGNQYFDLQATTANTDFEGANLGSFSCTSALILNGAQNKVYKCNTENILNSFLNYRIYLTSDTPPAFTNNMSMPFLSNDGATSICSPSNGINQTWEQATSNTNILSALPLGTYFLEVYTTADYELSLGAGVAGTHFSNNGTFNYKATFSIVDTTAPIPDAATLSDITAECEVTSLTPPTATDNCGGSVTVTNDATLPISGEGTTTVVTWTYDDGNGNTSTQTQNVIIDDITAPTPDAATLSDITAECEVTSLTPPTATDNCGGSVTVTNDATLPILGEGTTTVVTWTYDDGNGNTSTQTQNVIIDDITAPTPDAATLSDITAECEVTSLTPPTATDNCGGSVTVTNDATLPISGEGTTTVVTWTYDDGNGNTSTQTQNVIIDDITAPTPDAATLSDITVECEVTSLTPPSATDNCGGLVTVTNDATLPISGEGTTTVVTWTYDDGNGNTSTQAQNVIIDDVSGPVVPTLPVITGQCDATVPVPTTTDGCSGTITGITTDPLSYNTQGSFAVTWNFDDGNGNNIDVVQNVVINDTTDPVAVCQDLTIQLDNTTGLATITGAQIDNGSTDNCGNVNFSLSQNSFDCTNIGTNVIILTVDDGNGNTDTCTATVTVTSPTISGGTVLGFLNNNQTIADEDNLVEVTACPDEPQNASFNLYGHTGTIAYWQTSNNGGVTWTNVANTTTTYFYPNILETTLIRAVIQIGSCQATSSIIIVAVIPPDVPPTIVGPDEFTICLGESITVVAESSFGINPELDDGGQFNQGNLPGWEVDGLNGITNWNASGSNSDPTGWRGISNGNGNNGSNITAGVRYKNQGGNKFAISYGDFGAPNITTLETPVFNTLGLSNASLDFQSAYHVQAGAMGIVELSVNGGATYSEVLFSFSGPGDSGGFINLGNGVNNVPTIQLQDPSNAISIDLTNYIGLTNLKIRFTFTSTANSSWAIDGITIPQAPVDEVIEWEDGTGTVVTTGSSTLITPVTPGVQTYGVTSLINGCRADGPEGTEFVSVNVSLAYAGKDITPIAGECGQDTVSLNAYDNSLTAADNIVNEAFDNNYITGTYPGTGEAGVWNVVTAPTGCGNSFSFSNLGDPRATFTGNPGTYTLSWTVDGCIDTVEVTLDNCQSLDFDGVNDHVNFNNSHNLSGDFSMSLWIKPESIGGQRTLISKRDPNNSNTGYDLKLNNTGRLVFSYDNNSINSDIYNLGNDRWYHISVVHNNNTYYMYIDGIEVYSGNGTSPTTNAADCILGATERPVGTRRFFNGWMDELRIWNTALTVNQIRETMNQEIEDNTAVRGTVIPLDIAGLNWTDLDGYYRMDVNCGYLTAYKGVRGRLRNINSAQQETAPIPYTSRVDGQDWATDNTWTNFNVWDAPNSLGIDGTTPIDWNIVQLSHDVNSGNKDITVLGLISDTSNKTLDIKDPMTAQDETNDGQFLRVTHYLKLDGDIDLFGESQLLQDEGSLLDVTSSGKLERDQQGTTNLYNYNYWSSPVSTLSITSNNNPYSIAAILKDGTTSSAPLNLQ